MKRSLAAGFGALVVIACTNSTGPATTFIDDSAQAQCSWELNCCTDVELRQMHGHVIDSTNCFDYASLALADARYIISLAVSEGRIKVDDKQAKACLEKLNARACNPKTGTPPPTVDPNEEDPCDFVFVGNTAVGKECLYADECVRGAHCVFDGKTVGRGACVPYQQFGDICNAGKDCDPKVKGLYCAKQDYTCHVRGKVGEACAYTTDAAGDNPTLPMMLECDNTPGTYLYCDTISKTCKTLPGKDENCLTPPPPGVGYVCSPDPSTQLTCDTSNGTPGICKAPAGSGESCKTVGCAKGLYCDKTTATNPVCAALPGLNEDCQPSNHICATPYYCKYDTATSGYLCAEPANVGESCTSIPCNTGLYCDPSNTTCKNKLADGSACTSPIQCISGSCPTGVCAPAILPVQCSGR